MWPRVLQLIFRVTVPQCWMLQSTNRLGRSSATPETLSFYLFGFENWTTGLNRIKTNCVAFRNIFDAFLSWLHRSWVNCAFPCQELRVCGTFPGITVWKASACSFPACNQATAQNMETSHSCCWAPLFLRRHSFSGGLQRIPGLSETGWKKKRWGWLVDRCRKGVWRRNTKQPPLLCSVQPHPATGSDRIDSSVSLWDVETGKKHLYISNAHVQEGLTCRALEADHRGPEWHHKVCILHPRICLFELMYGKVRIKSVVNKTIVTILSHTGLGFTK